MFVGLLWFIFVVSALLVGLIILIQEGKGGGLGEAFGGMGAETFGVKASAATGQGRPMNHRTGDGPDAGSDNLAKKASPETKPAEAVIAVDDLPTVAPAKKPIRARATTIRPKPVLKPTPKPPTTSWKEQRK